MYVKPAIKLVILLCSDNFESAMVNYIILEKRTKLQFIKFKMFFQSCTHFSHLNNVGT